MSKPLRLRPLAHAVLIGSAYLAAFLPLAALSRHLSHIPGITLWYAPAGLSLFWLLQFGTAYAPWVFLAEILAALVFKEPLPLLALILAAGGTAGLTALGAAWVRRRAGTDWPRWTARELSSLVLIVWAAGFLNAAVNVAIGTSFGRFPQRELPHYLLDWWSGIFLGALNILPLLAFNILPVVKNRNRITIRRLIPPGASRFRTAARSAVQAAFIPLSLWLAFASPLGGSFNRYLCLLVLIWIVLTHGFAGAALSIPFFSIGALLLVLPHPVSLDKANFLFFLNTLTLSGLFLGIFLNDRRRADEERQKTLRESEERYRRLVELAPDAIIIHNRGIVVFANSAALRLLGASSPEQLAGRSALAYVHPDSQTAVRDRWRQLEEIAEVPLIEEKYLRFDGVVLDVEVAANSFVFYGQRSVQLIVRDISPRKRIEDALASEKERLAVTLRSIGDGVITTDTQGQVVLMNRVAETLTGWTQPEAAGKPLSEVFCLLEDRNRPECLNPVSRVVTSGNIVTLSAPYKLLSRDGLERTISDSGAPIRDRESKIVGVVIVFRDITERLKTEEELLRARKLESVGLLAGGIAHDFNNLLTAILGNLSILQSLPLPRAEQIARLNEAEHATLRARDLTRQLLTFSKGGAPIKKVVLLATLVRDSAAFSLSGSPVNCEFQLPPDLWPVNADEGQISQVVNNLIVNAQQAMPEGGTIRIRGENVTLGPESEPSASPGRYVKISVTDQGRGISPDIRERIFDPYFTTKGEGRGLGLATVYSILKNHAGLIQVESETGAGATFHFYLPAAEMRFRPGKPEAAPARPGRGRILVMDDESMVREMAVEMLHLLGYDADSAADGEEMLRRYQEARTARRPFTAVLMDLTVPGGMGGKAAIDALRRIDPQAKAIVSSGYSNDPVLSDYGKYGFAEVMAKPYTLKDISRVLQKVLGAKDREGK